MPAQESSAVKEVKGHFLERIKRTPTIESFRFHFAEQVSFSPGQFLEVIFDPQKRNNKELNKYLSFSSSPTQPYREVTKRLSDSIFSQRLKRLTKGDEVVFRAPLGKCIFKEEYRKIAFLIGGIGITPVISIIEYIVENNLDTDVELFYSNRDEEEIAFRPRLDSWRENPRIKVWYTITRSRPKDPSCISGSIDKELLKEKASALPERVVFIFGPPGMVGAMKTLCEGLGCSKEQVKTESFIGY